MAVVGSPPEGLMMASPLSEDVKLNQSLPQHCCTGVLPSMPIIVGTLSTWLATVSLIDTIASYINLVFTIKQLAGIDSCLAWTLLIDNFWVTDMSFK